MRFSKLLISVAVVASTLLLGLPANVRADTIFDNLGSGFDLTAAALISPRVTRHAMRFTVSAGSNRLGFTLTSVELPLARPVGTFDQIDLSVYSDNAGEPGAALETVRISGITNTATLFTASFSGGTFLADGTTYWVVIQHLGGEDFFAWNFSNDQSGGSNRAFFDGAWSTGRRFDLGFTVNGTPVAGPAVGLTQDLIVDVVNLNLQNGIANGLDAKLDAVLRALDDMNENNDVAACNALEGFINAVEAQSGSHIPVEDAIALIEDTQQIIALLGCSP